MSDDDDDKSFLATCSDDDSSDESSTASDSFAGSNSTKGDIEAAQDQQVGNGIGGQDSVGVSRWRTMVIIMLSLTAASVITSTYMFLSREVTDEFEKSVRFKMRAWRDNKYQKNSKRQRTAISSNTYSHIVLYTAYSSNKVQRLS